jgi:hypothetical protein
LSTIATCIRRTLLPTFLVLPILPSTKIATQVIDLFVVPITLSELLSQVLEGESSFSINHPTLHSSISKWFLSDIVIAAITQCNLIRMVRCQFLF